MTNRTDTFNRADTTNGIGTPSDAGSAWSVLAGTWGISSNRAYTSAAVANSICVLESSVTAVEVQATIAVLGGTAGLIARAADVDNYLLLEVIDGGTPLVLYKRVGGSLDTIGSSGGAPFLASTDVIKVRVDSANLITVYHNGVSRISVTDSAGAANTKHGLRTHIDTGWRWDDFTITEIGGGGGGSKLGLMLKHNEG